jgi:hypothetical protein
MGLLVSVVVALYVVAFFFLPLIAFAALPFICAFVAWKNWRRSRGMAVGAILVGVALPAAWVGSSVFQFRQACASVPPMALVSKPPPQDGFLLSEEGGRQLVRLDLVRSINARAFVGSSAMSYVEEGDPSQGKVRRNFLVVKKHYGGRELEEVGVESADAPLSQYELTSEVVPRGLFGTPLYDVRHSIRRLSDGTTVATVTDVVFGGGLIGPYMGLFGPHQGQDGEHLSCGYAEGVGPWRPQYVDEPRWKQYREADLRFVKAVLK